MVLSECWAWCWRYLPGGEWWLHCWLSHQDLNHVKSQASARPHEVHGSHRHSHGSHNHPLVDAARKALIGRPVVTSDWPLFSGLGQAGPCDNSPDPGGGGAGPTCLLLIRKHESVFNFAQLKTNSNIHNVKSARNDEREETELIFYTVANLHYCKQPRTWKCSLLSNNVLLCHSDILKISQFMILGV